MTIAAAAGAGAAALAVLVLGRKAPRAGRGSASGAPRADRSGADRRALIAFAAVAVGSAALTFGPAAAFVVAALLVAAPQWSRRRSTARRRAATAEAVPDLVEVFLIAASAGHPVAASLAVVGPRSPLAVRAEVLEAGARFRRGLPLADCLDHLGRDLAPAGTSLAEALRQAAASGVPVVPLLEGVAATARDERRRRAQEGARRLPVTMLFPLVLCILPAAVLLAVVPVLVVSVGSLGR